ncbi:hypothetical protein SUGI_0871620 [Cryptomeria japonica]|nr:hypothetical protein SUGI_0871620 [Cryptomeria japonica]
MIWLGRSHKDGKWQARDTQEEAAEAYDMATIKLRGEKAVTNFDTSRYDVKTMMSSALTLPVRREKQSRVQVEDKERLNEDKDDSLFESEPTTTNVESSGPSISSCTGCITPTTINEHTISKPMAATHELVMGGSSL